MTVRQQPVPEDIVAPPTPVETPEGEKPAFDVDYAGHQYRQSRIGLEMTPAQRLAWLERKKVEMQRLLGKARGNPKK